MKCKLVLQDQDALVILMNNIHDLTIFLLKDFTIKTFKKLIKKVANIQEEAK